MSRRRNSYKGDDLESNEEYEEQYDSVDEEDSEDGGGGKTKRRRGKSNSEDDEDDDEGYGGGNGGSRRGAKRRRNSVSDLFELEAIHDSDEEDVVYSEGDDDFIDAGDDIPDENADDDRRAHPRPLLPREDEQEEDVDEMQRKIQERYSDKAFNVEYDDYLATEVEHQAQLPSVSGPKLWVLKCAIGHEREMAFCLMQKYIDNINAGKLRISSAIALDHLKGYIYVEADKEAYVREAVAGMRNIFPRKITQVPIKEMTDVLSVSVESKAIDVCVGSWVRVKIGIYKGDLSKVVQVDDVRQRATVKLIPRIDMQALVNKMEGRQAPKKTAFTPPARFMNLDEASELHLHVERKRDKVSGNYFDKIEGMMFQDGFLCKNFSLKSLKTQNVQPTFDELERFRQPGEKEDGNVSSFPFGNRKKYHFVKGDRVIVVKGDLINLKGWVEKVDVDSVHIKTNENGLPKTLTFNDKELCKYFEPGNHVLVVSGATKGASGLVVSVEGHVVNIVSDTTKELHRVFADNVVETSAVASAATKISSDYDINDLVLLDDNSFGVIIRAEGEAFQVLKGVPERLEVALVKLGKIKCKIDKTAAAKDRYNNPLSVKDVVRVLDGPSMGKQGPIEHMFRETLFISDRHQLRHGGFICIKSTSCMMVGGSRANGDRNVDTMTSRFAHLKTIPRVHQSHMRPCRGRLVGTVVKIRVGNYKGHKGRVVDDKGSIVRVELESQMKVVTVDRSYISDNVNSSTPSRETSRYGMGSETPMRPYMTPVRDSCATPRHDGMRTPVRDRAWNPCMTPMRDCTS